jgi:hypothetical protein
MKMKEITELIFPGELRYTKDHLWLRHADDPTIIGITDNRLCPESTRRSDLP